jgi:predicted MPP superfamily phosphohydrolase
MIFAALLAVLVAGLVVGRHLRVTHVRVPMGIATPLRIAVLGDFHVAVGGYGAGIARKAVREAMRQRPDAIILVGDFVSGKPGIRHIRAVFKGIHAPLGVYAVQGNHEHWTDANAVRRELEADGVRLLVNENVALRKGKTQLALVAIDDTWTGRVDWEAAYRDVPPAVGAGALEPSGAQRRAKVPILLASHNPDAALDPEAQRAALIVSGHTHGGLVGPARPLLRWINRLTGHGLPPGTSYGRAHLSGLFREPWGWVYVTTGVTPGFAPPRWFMRPEVVVLELADAKPARRPSRAGQAEAPQSPQS